VIQLLASAFFALAFLAAAVFLHLTVRANWARILLALRGELGVRAPAPRAAVPGAALRRAAF
jgi:hypothetical protein